MAIEGVYGMGEIYPRRTIRLLKDGSIAHNLETPITLTIKTRCPEKYMLIDMETGEKYVGYSTSGNSSWRKIITDD